MGERIVCGLFESGVEALWTRRRKYIISGAWSEPSVLCDQRRRSHRAIRQAEQSLGPHSAFYQFRSGVLPVRGRLDNIGCHWPIQRLRVQLRHELPQWLSEASGLVRQLLTNI